MCNVLSLLTWPVARRSLKHVKRQSRCACMRVRCLRVCACFLNLGGPADDTQPFQVGISDRERERWETDKRRKEKTKTNERKIER